MVHLITVVLVILALASGGLTAPTTTSNDLPLIQWPVGCDEYTVTTGRRPSADWLNYETSTSEPKCRSLCTSRQDCGGFVTYGSTLLCFLYNINDDIISDHLNDNWWQTDSSLTLHSKNCQYSVGASDMSCNEYKNQYEQNQYISYLSMWRIMYAWSISNLTPGECHTWCTLYPGCRSVGYRWQTSMEEGYCYLYKTTISELMNSGHSGDVLQNTDSSEVFTTYDRYCGLLPYIPGGGE